MEQEKLDERINQDKFENDIKKINEAIEYVKNIINNLESPEEVKLANNLDESNIKLLYDTFNELSREELINIFSKIGKEKNKTIEKLTQNKTYSSISEEQFKKKIENMKEKIKQLEIIREHKIKIREMIS